MIPIKFGTVDWVRDNKMSLIKRIQAINLFAKIEKIKPKKVTGVYITSTGISWSYRTNPRKFPKNFVLLWPKK